jgi:hypothetical protein
MDQGISAGSVLAKLVALLMLLMIVEVFNPLQGGLQVGIAGMLFYLAPLLWFWVGRTFASKELMEFFTFRVLIAIGLTAMLWGTYQTYFGLLGFEQQWVQVAGYQAMYITDEVLRAIGFFTSSAEYQRCLVVTAVVCVAAWLTRRSWLIVLVPPLLVTIFLSAARGPMIIFMAAAVLMWAVRSRSPVTWMPRLLVATLAGGVALVMVLLLLQSHSFGGRIAPLVTRQVEGLLNPINPEKSTAVGHADLVRAGIVSGFTSPAGLGLGATTLAASKYGKNAVSTEVDLSNVMISLGIIGGILYEVIAAFVFVTALRWWTLERSPLSLATLGLIAATFGAWLIGGEYSMVAIAWFCIGAMDRLCRNARLEQQRRRRDANRIDHA